MADDEDFIFSQEAMRQQGDLLFSNYNFGSEPQQNLDSTQQEDAAAVDGYGRISQACANSANGNTTEDDGCTRRKNGKIFSDPIHGTFRLQPVNVAVIDTPQFQRLRELHQLGLTHLVFPGAVHTRFEHSLGTSLKAFEVAERIYRMQGNELDMEKDDIRLVSLAGLCHDLGHGPFSHVFEMEFMRRKLLGAEPDSEEHKALSEWHHETMSTRILQHLIDDNNIEGISNDDVKRIADLIKGDVHEDRGFLFDIVANKRNGVDVDKMDYLQRDAKMCDVNIGCDFKRLIMLSMVVDNQIAYKWTEYSNIWDLFHARGSMHRKVYSHRKTKAVEFMVVDALLEADQAMGFSQYVHEPEDFCRLDDRLLYTIENHGQFDRRRKASQQPEDSVDNGADSRLRKAQDIIKRLRRRELYRFGNQFMVPHEYLQSGRWEALSKEFTAQNVASCHDELQPSDVIVSTTKIDYTAGLGNPLDNVLFFDNFQDRVGRRIQPHQVVGILPQYHQERILRVYTPRQEPAYKTAIDQALTRWCKRMFGSNVQMATPARHKHLARLPTREDVERDADPRRGPPAGLPPRSNGATTSAATAGNQSIPVYRGALSGSGNSGACPGSGPAATAAGGGGGAVSGADPRVNPGSAAAAGSAAGASRTHQHGAGDDGGGGGTPTRSTPMGMGSVLSVAAGADGAGVSEGTAATGGRTKRPRTSGALFQD